MSMSLPLTAVDPQGRDEPTVLQHAVRLLVLLDRCGLPTKPADPSGTVAVLRAEMQLQALDFWLRNPDYLAGELMTKLENGELGGSYLQVVEDLLESQEPDLHWYPMPRWFHGAYEAIDDAFSVLSAYGLAVVRRVGSAKSTARSQFFLTEAGRKAVEELKKDPLLSWYVGQAELVKLVAGNDNGSTLKKRQYAQAEYASTKLGTKIAPIHAGVAERLETAQAAQANEGGADASTSPAGGNT
jgi:hypothetical protein